jgi:hypothetical protein
MEKPEYIQVQVTKEEKDLLKQIAVRRGRIGLSGVIRDFIQTEAQRQGITVSQPIESAPQATR